MKKLLAIALSIMLVTIFAMAITVQADEMTLKSIDTIMSEIKTEQGVQSNDKIDVSKVSQAKLEELGDSVMEAMIGNTAMHDQMDIRIGGDGSAALTAFHIRLGYNYLSGYPNGMMTLMSSGMMGTNGVVSINGGFNGMMGYGNYFGNGGMMGYFGWGGILIGIIVLLVCVAILFFIIRAFSGRSNRPMDPHLQNHSMNTPMEILKTRYAKGELTKEEYEKMVEHLKS